MNHSRLLLVLAIAVLVAIPSLSLADASVVQDSCVFYEEGGKTFVKIYFTIVNFSLPVNVCDLHFMPEPQPVLPECEMLDIGTPPGWSGFLSPMGGADFFALTPEDCISAPTAKSGFWFLLDPGFCCYVTQFTGPTGSVLLEQEECFTLCQPVSIEVQTWGQVKSRYR